MTLKIVLADDHRILREGLRDLLQKLPDIEVIAEADDGRSAVNIAECVSGNGKFFCTDKCKAESMKKEM